MLNAIYRAATPPSTPLLPMSAPDASALFHRTVAHTQREAETYAPGYAPPLPPMSVTQHRTLGECVRAAGYADPAPTSATGWQLGGRYDVDGSAYVRGAVRFFAELRALRRQGCAVRTYVIHETGVIQIEYHSVARPRPVLSDPTTPPERFHAAEGAECGGEADAAHAVAEIVGGA